MTRHALAATAAAWIALGCAHAPAAGEGKPHNGVAMTPLEALQPGEARQTAADLSGRWIPIPPDAAPGTVVRPTVCYEGIQFLVLQQTGDRVSTMLVYRGSEGGAERREWSTVKETTDGTYRKHHLRLTGEHVIESGTVDSDRIERKRTPVEYDLTLDPKSMHLVGTRAGHPHRLAPLELRARPEGCGDPPP